MLQFLKDHLGRRGEEGRAMALGALEFELMQLLWEQGESCVRELVPKLSRPLAYTTVMTTLDRLYKKGLLNRQESERAYCYSPRFTRAEWERMRAGSLVAGFLSGPSRSRELLLSALLDAVGGHDPDLLDKLEKKIRDRRKALARKLQS